MKGSELLKKLKRYAREHGLRYSYETHRGKGSHGTVYLGTARCTIKDRKKEIGPGLLKAMCRQLGIDPEDL